MRLIHLITTETNNIYGYLYRANMCVVLTHIMEIWERYACPCAYLVKH
jgi:hypothetical protein